VPLCGKSQGMIWLAQRGYKVLGVEASDLAVEAFFEKSTLPVEQRHHRGFDLRRSYVHQMAAIIEPGASRLCERSYLLQRRQVV